MCAGSGLTRSRGAPALFARTAHPQYLGSSLCISAVGLVLHDAARPGNTLLAVWWVLLYVLTGIVEEGACHSVEPFAPKAKGADPFTDTDTRPVVRLIARRSGGGRSRPDPQVSAEAARLVLMAPVVALRWALFAAILLSFLIWRAVIQARAPRDRAAWRCARLFRNVQAVLSPSRAASGHLSRARAPRRHPLLPPPRGASSSTPPRGSRRRRVALRRRQSS
jgi:hypothetical protein